VVVKGGHLAESEDAVDVIFNGVQMYHERSEYIKSENTHGTGCTFSSAIAAGLAKGKDPLEAIRNAKRFITAAIREGLPLGKGHGPTNHQVKMKTPWME